VYGYDRNSGAFPIPVYTRDPRAIAIVLAQELSRILNEPLAVSQAEFVNSSEAELYTYTNARTGGNVIADGRVCASAFAHETLTISAKKKRDHF